jgi:hypothetical protein
LILWDGTGRNQLGTCHPTVLLTGEADLLDLLVGTKLIPNGREMGVRGDHLKDIGRYACPASKLRTFRLSGMTGHALE